MSNNKEVELNAFAIRCFRDMADRDYIHARLAYKARLIPQFLWSSLHCLEKYLKCILILNRIKAKKGGRFVSHEVSPLLDIINNSAKFTLTLSKDSMGFIQRLDSGAKFRYLEVSYANREHDIIHLDRTVWEIRRYCRVLDYSINIERNKKNMLRDEIIRVENARPGPNSQALLTGGWLEKILNRSGPTADALVWKNLYFSRRVRRSVKLEGYIEVQNSPLLLYPEVIEEAKKYVLIPAQVVAGYEELRRERSTK